MGNGNLRTLSKIESIFKPGLGGGHSLGWEVGNHRAIRRLPADLTLTVVQILVWVVHGEGVGSQGGT